MISSASHSFSGGEGDAEKIEDADAVFFSAMLCSGSDLHSFSLSVVIGMGVRAGEGFGAKEKDEISSCSAISFSLLLKVSY